MAKKNEAVKKGAAGVYPAVPPSAMGYQVGLTIRVGDKLYRVAGKWEEVK